MTADYERQLVPGPGKPSQFRFAHLRNRLVAIPTNMFQIVNGTSRCEAGRCLTALDNLSAAFQTGQGGDTCLSSL
jgi:hypothetical protein